MDIPSILLTLNENATHKISEELSYSDARIIVEYVKELQDTLKNIESSSRIIESYDPKGLVDFLYKHKTKVGGKIVYDIPRHHKYMNLDEAIKHYQNSNSL